MADGPPAAPLTPGFLDVARSLSGRAWRQRPAEAPVIRAHMQGLGLEEPLARALAARGVKAEEGVDFLEPTLKALFPNPSSFMDMDVAAEAIVSAIEAGERIHVFADYDVDGASSAALLVRWFRALGHDLPLYVPDRLTEGYGPSPMAFDRLKGSGADLVITVDCGAAANEAIAHAGAIGLRVVVIDHHMMREEPPACVAVVNPNRPGDTSGQGNLAAAGVVFVLLAALNREARKRGLFADTPEPDIRQWLDLAALGAICDVTGLTVRPDGIDALRGFLNTVLAGEQADADALDWVEVDALIDPGAATRALFEGFERLAPFGPANPEPLFALSGVQAREPVQMNGGHVRCRLVGADGSSVRAIAWRCADLPTGKALLAGQGGLSVVGRLKADDWNGRRGVQLEIEDIADPRMAV